VAPSLFSAYGFFRTMRGSLRRLRFAAKRSVRSFLDPLMGARRTARKRSIRRRHCGNVGSTLESAK
jgi:hypothetical protein